MFGKKGSVRHIKLQWTSCINPHNFIIIYFNASMILWFRTLYKNFTWSNTIIHAWCMYLLLWNNHVQFKLPAWAIMWSHIETTGASEQVLTDHGSNRRWKTLWGNFYFQFWLWLKVEKFNFHMESARVWDQRFGAYHVACFGERKNYCFGYL